MLQKNVHKINARAQEKEMHEQRLREKLEIRYEKRPYSERWAVTVPVSNLFSWAFSGYAFAVESFAVAFGLYLHYQNTVSLILGITLGIIVGIGIEVLKRVCNENMFHSGLSEGDWSGGNILGMLFAMAASTGLAFWGGLNLPHATTTPPEYHAPALENIEQLRADLQEDINTQIKGIEDAKKTGKKDASGKYTSNTLAKKITDMETKLQEAIELKNKTIADAQQRNLDREQAAKGEHNTKTLVYTESKEDTGWLLAVISLVIELLIPFTFWAKERYYLKSALERGTGSTTIPITAVRIPTPPVIPIQQNQPPIYPIQQNQPPIVPPFDPGQTNPNQAPPVTQTTPLKRTIVQGFVFEKDPEWEKIQLLSKKPQTHVYTEFEPPKEIEKIVEKEVEKVITVQQQTPPKSTYTHTKDNGETVEMRLSEIRARIRQYTERVEDAENRILKAESDMDKKLWKETMRDRARTLLYWRDAERLLLEQIGKGGEDEHK